MFKINQLWRKANDHPLAKPQDRQKLLGELVAEDPYKALGEINFWLESVKEAESFALSDRITLVKLLDETGQPHRRKLSNDYLAAAVRMQKIQEHQLWAVISDFSQRRYNAYLQCLEAIKQSGTAALGNQQPTLMVRAMRALAEQKKWLYMRYRVIDDRIWREMATLTFLAESERAARSLLSAYPQERETTTVVQELIKAFMLDVSSPNSLTPKKIEITERIVTSVASAFEIGEARTASSVFYFDLVTAKPPARIPSDLQFSSTTFFFSAGDAIPKLQNLAATLQEKGKQPDMDFAENATTQELLEVVRHLIVYWSPTSPQRQHERSQEIARFHVLHSFTDVHYHISNYAKKTDPVFMENKDILYMERVDLKLYGFVTDKTKKLIREAALKHAQTENLDEKTETWTMENKSAGGFGAVIPQLNEDWVKVGALVAVKRQDENQWLIGIIRRMVRDADLKVLVGLQALSATPAQAVELRSLTDTRHLKGLALNDTTPGQCLLLAGGSFAPNKKYQLWLPDSKQTITLTKVLERGDDFEYVQFAVVPTS